ncbi:MAG: hypothetical protein DRH15_11165 [Deltaproteobacteria bacterium]|nr:MAG: hypothetical protein DRH15_11165 [Deltaproteobacteria bacterium]
MREKKEYSEADSKKELRKSKILGVALKEFSEKGYDKAVLEDIALKAGVAKGTIYLYYKDKKDLFNHSILFIIDKFVEIIENIVESNLSPIDKIKSVIRDQVKYFVDNKHLFNLFQMAFQEKLIEKDGLTYSEIIDKGLMIDNLQRKIVEEARKLGAIKNEFSTDDIIVVCDGVVTSILKEVRARELYHEYKNRIDKEGYNLNERLENTIKIIFEGIAKKEV